MDAETSTLIPMHGGGFDVTAFAHQQGGSIDMHMSVDCALALQRSQTQAIALQDVRGIEKAQNGRGWNDDGSAYTVDTRATQGVAYPINMQIATRHNALGENTGLGIGSESDPAFTLLRDHHHAVCAHSAVRRLTPRECERLQGFPDDYTLVPHRNRPAADGPRYKALGNSMAVPVMRWIGERIQKVHEIAS